MSSRTTTSGRAEATLAQSARSAPNARRRSSCGSASRAGASRIASTLASTGKIRASAATSDGTRAFGAPVEHVEHFPPVRAFVRVTPQETHGQIGEVIGDPRHDEPRIERVEHALTIENVVVRAVEWKAPGERLVEHHAERVPIGR